MLIRMNTRIAIAVAFLLVAGCEDRSRSPDGVKCSTGGECQSYYCWNGSCVPSPEDDHAALKAFAIGFISGLAGGTLGSRRR